MAEAQASDQDRADLGLVLDSLQLGVLLVDSGAHVMRVNDVTAQLVVKEASDLLDGQPGEALCCIHADETPEGCGHSVACPTCPIRTSIGVVLREGRPLRDIEAPMRLTVDGEEKDVFLSVNATPITMRDEEHVLLTLENETERKRAEQDRDRLQAELLEASHKAGMAEVATGVLHNVGNALNSVNISTQSLKEKVEGCPIDGLGKVLGLMEEHGEDLGDYISNDEKGRLLPRYLGELFDHLRQDRDATLEHLRSLVGSVEHIKGIVSAQEAFVGTPGLAVSVSLAALAQEAVAAGCDRMAEGRIDSGVEASEPFDTLTDKHKVQKILTNLIDNAIRALGGADREGKRMMVRLARIGEDRVAIEVEDNGVGISGENLERIFQHGFSTSQNGRGFGLHECANAAKELGGSLRAFSDGLGLGAMFRLEVPLSSRTASSD